MKSKDVFRIKMNKLIIASCFLAVNIYAQDDNSGLSDLSTANDLIYLYEPPTQQNSLKAPSEIEEKPFSCTVDNCGKSFLKKRSLREHVRYIHYKIKRVRYSCPEAVKSKPFIAKTRALSLVARNYPCTYPNCDGSFIRNQHLIRHMLMHTEEKTFLCEVENCGKSFSRNDNRKQHMLLVHQLK